MFKNISYRENVDNYSRANIPNQKVFYGANSRETTYAELMPTWLKNSEIGTELIVTIGVWEITNNVWMGIIPDRDNIQFKPFYEKQDPITKEYWDFISKYFRMHEFELPSVYKFTSAYCNALLSKARKNNLDLNGIMFTSVQYKNGWNIAMPSKFADKNLSLVDVFKEHFIKIGMHGNLPEYINNPSEFVKANLDRTLKKINWI